VRMWTLKDKKSMFRAKEPDRHCVEVIIQCGNTGVMIRDWWYEDPKEATEQYDRIIGFLT
jgi:hypothetical protein